MSLKYFGTDGIRGNYGKSPINEAFAKKFARGLVKYLNLEDHSKCIVIGRDTRTSGYSLSESFIDVFVQSGYDVLNLEVTPTPQVSFAVTQNNACLGIAITASHNPACDNGFKLFNARGTKFSPEQEKVIESRIDDESALKESSKTGSVKIITDQTRSDYFKKLNSVFSELDLSDMTIAIDTANGATVDSTPAYLLSRNAKIIRIGDQPNGENINNGIGSEHPDALKQVLKENKCDVGIAHDGDGDRVIILDQDGNELSGEHFMAIIARYSHTNKTTTDHPLITTIQSNLALDLFLEKQNASTIRTPVGDRNVVYQMIESKATFGGENSGHYVFSDVLPTGDGLIAALKLLLVLQQTGKTIRSLKDEMMLFPSQCTNLKIKEKKPMDTLSSLKAACKEADEVLQGKGRTLLRYSGTENKLRVLVECESQETLDIIMKKLCDAAKNDLVVL